MTNYDRYYARQANRRVNNYSFLFISIYWWGN
jgi:hypothetical protein